jgi:hypothetical protein
MATTFFLSEKSTSLEHVFWLTHVNPTSFRSETNLFSADLSHREARQERPALIRRWLGRLVKLGRQRGQRLAVLIVSPQIS